MDERLHESLEGSQKGFRERASGFIDQAARYFRGTSRWTRLSVGGAYALGAGIIASACAGESVQPALLQLNQGPKVEVTAKNTFKELTPEEQTMLDRTVAVMEQFIYLDEKSRAFLNSFVSDTETVSDELIRSTTSKKNTGGSVSTMELYQSGEDKQAQAYILRSEVHTNSQGQKVTEKYRFGFGENGALVKQQLEIHTPKRILDIDPTTGNYVEYDEEILGPKPVAVSHEDLTRNAQKIVKGADESTHWNEFPNQLDTRYADAISSIDLKQADGSVIRVIVYSSDIAELEVTFPQHKADPIKPRPQPRYNLGTGTALSNYSFDIPYRTA